MKNVVFRERYCWIWHDYAWDEEFALLVQFCDYLIRSDTHWMFFSERPPINRNKRRRWRIYGAVEWVTILPPRLVFRMIVTFRIIYPPRICWMVCFRGFEFFMSTMQGWIDPGIHSLQFTVIIVGRHLSKLFQKL